MPRALGVIVISAIAMVLLAAAPAFGAQTSPADSQYGAVKGEQAGGGGSLPFTGLNLLVLVAVGGGVAASGVSLRALAQRTPRS
jgi:hypothetical protein